MCILSKEIIKEIPILQPEEFYYDENKWDLSKKFLDMETAISTWMNNTEMKFKQANLDKEEIDCQFYFPYSGINLIRYNLQYFFGLYESEFVRDKTNKRIPYLFSLDITEMTRLRHSDLLIPMTRCNTLMKTYCQTFGCSFKYFVERFVMAAAYECIKKHEYQKVLKNQKKNKNRANIRHNILLPVLFLAKTLFRIAEPPSSIPVPEHILNEIVRNIEIRTRWILSILEEAGVTPVILNDIKGGEPIYYIRTRDIERIFNYYPHRRTHFSVVQVFDSSVLLYWRLRSDIEFSLSSYY